MAAPDPVPHTAGGHDLVAHLYGTALQLMQQHGVAFLPLQLVQDQLGWPDDVLGRVVDHCVREDPVAGGAVRADWMDEGDRPAYGETAKRFIGIRPAAPAGRP